MGDGNQQGHGKQGAHGMHLRVSIREIGPISRTCLHGPAWPCGAGRKKKAGAPFLWDAGSVASVRLMRRA